MFAGHLFVIVIRKCVNSDKTQPLYFYYYFVNLVCSMLNFMFEISFRVLINFKYSVVILIYFYKVFHSLLKAHALEARSVVKQALEILTPAMPGRMEDGNVSGTLTI